VSADPVLDKYLPKGLDDFDGKHDYFYHVAHDNTSKLMGLGGIYNTVNLNVYHYAGNNPTKYIDPDGNQQIPSPIDMLNSYFDNMNREDAKFVSDHHQINRGFHNALGFIDGFYGISIFYNAVHYPQNEHISKKTNDISKQSYKIGKGYGEGISKINFVAGFGKMAITKTGKYLGEAQDVLKGLAGAFKLDRIPAKINSLLEGVGKAITEFAIKPEINKKIEKK